MSPTVTNLTVSPIIQHLTQSMQILMKLWFTFEFAVKLGKKGFQNYRKESQRTSVCNCTHLQMVQAVCAKSDLKSSQSHGLTLSDGVRSYCTFNLPRKLQAQQDAPATQQKL